MPMLNRVMTFPPCCWNCGHRVFVEGEPCCRSPEVLKRVTAEYPELRDAAGRLDVAAFDDLLDADVDTVCDFHVKEKEIVSDGTTVTVVEEARRPSCRSPEVRRGIRQDLQEEEVKQYRRFRWQAPKNRPKSAVAKPS